MIKYQRIIIIAVWAILLVLPSKSQGINNIADVNDLSGQVKSGENEIEIRVANTLALHYSIPLKAMHLGPVKLVLVGPVHLKLGKD